MTDRKEYKVTVEQKDGTTNNHIITVDSRRPVFPQVDGFIKHHYGRSRMLVRSVEWDKVEPEK